MNRPISLEAEGVLRLKAVHIPIKNGVTIIGGNNTQGKSSVLRCFAIAIGGKEEIPEVPVHTGEEQGRIILKTEEFTISVRIKPNRDMMLEIKNNDGFKFPSPRALLDKVFGKRAFDPLVFAKMEPLAQLNQLKTLVGLDFTSLEQNKMTLYDERRMVNREAEKAKNHAQSITKHPDAPAEEVSSLDVLAEIEKANTNNQAIIDHFDETEAISQDAIDKGVEVGDIDSAIGLCEVQIADLQKKIESHKKKREEVAAEIKKLRTIIAEREVAHKAWTKIDTEPLKAKLTGLEQMNFKVRQNKQRAAAFDDWSAKTKKSEQLTTDIDKIEKDKEIQLAAAKFPIPGLSFNENGVLYDKLPFSQASDAQKLKISVAIGAAMAPEIPLMLIKDGSDLDDNSLAELSKLAEEKNLFLIVERVGKRDGTAIIIENGEVSAQPTT